MEFTHQNSSIMIYANLKQFFACYLLQEVLAARKFGENELVFMVNPVATNNNKNSVWPSSVMYPWF